MTMGATHSEIRRRRLTLKEKYSMILAKQVGFPLDLVIEIAAMGDIPVRFKNGEINPHEVTYGKGQRSALRVLLRGLEAL